jgi:hypothetical protein
MRTLPVKSALNASRSLLMACLCLGFVLLSCQTGEERTFENTLSYSKFFDSFSGYDRIVIEVKRPDGSSLGIVYQGKPVVPGDLNNLVVPGWDGGPVDIFVTGYMNGKTEPEYQERKRYDGTTKQTQSTDVIIKPIPPTTPPGKLNMEPDTLRLAVKGGAKSFTILVEPPGADKQIVWRLSDSTVVAQRSDGAFLGLAQGATKVWAAAKLNPEAVDTGWIFITEPVPVGSVRFLTKDPLVLFLGGASESLLIEVLPDLANSDVKFILSDSLKASLAGNELSPKTAGNFTVTARSLEDSTKSAVLTVTVREPLHIQGILPADTAVTLFLGGPGLTLTAIVLPDSAPQDVRWKSLSPTIVSAAPTTGSIAALQAGSAQIEVTSAADSAKRDTVHVTVKIDAPRLTVTADSVVSAGADVVFRVNAVQEYGQIDLFQWDLDGNGAWDDSLTGPWTGASVDLPTVTFKYERSGPVIARFRVRDSERNLGPGSHALRVVGGSAVSIDAPKNNSYTNQKLIQVEWKVNGILQDSLNNQDLSVGPNVITRSARDSAGKIYTANVTVTLDTTAPLKPIISGSSPTNVKPQWTWTSGGGGGSGEYRHRLGDAIFPADAPTVRDSAFILASVPVSGTTYTLFLQERDLAGNWSPPASLPIRYDVTAPVVAITSPQTSGIHYTSTPSVTLSGTASGAAGTSGTVAITQVNYKVGSGAPVIATFTAGIWSTPAIPLTEGVSVPITVTALDQAGNTGEATLNVLMDATIPSAPTISTAPAAEITAVKGDFAWTPGADGTTGSGLNGRYRYSINNGPWKDTSSTLLTNLPLIEGANIFAVQEQDRALLWSASATRNVLVDTAGPVITLTSHTSPANSASLSITLSGTVKDNGTAVAAMTVSGQQSGSGTVSITAGAWTTAALTLKTGANALLLSATDRLGNARTFPVSVNVNIPAPIVIITKPTDSLTVTPFDTITVFYTIDGGAVQSQVKTLVEGVNRPVIASPANASGNIGRDTVKITRDGTPPNAPTLTRGTTPSNTAATWTWTSNGDNTGGAGMRNPAIYQYSLNNGTTWTQTGTAQFQQTTEGSWTLIVREQDKAGNWSPSSTAQTMVVDKTKPVVAITGPRVNYVTSAGSVTITYKVDNGTPLTTTCTLSNLDGANTCTASSTDAANNTGTANLTVYRRANVYFVTMNGAGNKSGTTWETAMDAAGLAAAMGSSSFAGKTFWVGSGIITERLMASYSMSLYGGFDAALTPHDLTGRNPLGTRVNAYFQVTPASGLTVMTFNLDGFVLETFGANQLGNTVNLTNITFDPESPSNSNALYLLEDVAVTATNLTIKNQSFNSTVVWTSGTFKMVGGSISGNSANYPAVQNYGTMTMTNGAVISGNSSTSDSPYQVQGYSGTLTIGSGVSFTCTTPNFLNSGGACSKN